MKKYLSIILAAVFVFAIGATIASARISNPTVTTGADLSAAGALLQANNLSDVASSTASINNIGNTARYLSIGTTTAADVLVGGAKVLVNGGVAGGSIAMVPGATGQPTLLLNGFTNGVGGFLLNSSGNRTIQVTNSGSGGATLGLYGGTGTYFLGIGTSTPAQNLHVVGTSTFMDPAGIVNTGVLGIGTTAPNAPLTVVSGSGATGIRLRASNTTGTSILGFRVSPSEGSNSAEIQANRTNSPGAGDTELIFRTTQNGSLADVMRLTTNGSVGIGTSTPAFYFSVASSTTGSLLFGIDGKGHAISGGTAPTLSSCGSGPSVSGNDHAATVTVGSTASSCTVTFAAQYATAPHCVLSPRVMDLSNALTYTVSTSTLVVSKTSLGGSVFDYICAQ